MRLHPVSALGLLFCVASAALVGGCSDHHSVTVRADAGPEDGGLAADDAPDAAVAVVLAPSGAVVEPSVTVMSSGQFHLVGSMGVASGETAASQSYELRSATFEAQR